MSDSIEQEIKSKGLNAPRVTPEHVESVIRSEHYFTAADGVFAANLVRNATQFVGSDGYDQSLYLLTFCVLVTANGFTVTGESACASPENFNAEIGRKIARQKAVEKLYALEGYLLKQRLHVNAEMQRAVSGHNK